jgi:hypothetical protein
MLRVLLIGTVVVAAAATPPRAWANVYSVTIGIEGATVAPDESPTVSPSPDPKFTGFDPALGHLNSVTVSFSGADEWGVSPLWIQSGFPAVVSMPASYIVIGWGTPVQWMNLAAVTGYAGAPADSIYGQQILLLPTSETDPYYAEVHGSFSIDFSQKVASDQLTYYLQPVLDARDFSVGAGVDLNDATDATGSPLGYGPASIPQFAYYESDTIFGEFSVAYDYTPVPEPGSLLVIATGLLGLGYMAPRPRSWRPYCGRDRGHRHCCRS